MIILSVVFGLTLFELLYRDAIAAATATTVGTILIANRCTPTTTIHGVIAAIAGNGSVTRELIVLLTIFDTADIIICGYC